MEFEQVREPNKPLIDFAKLKKSQEYKRQVENGEDIFDSIDEFYVNMFILDLSAEIITGHYFVEDYHHLKDGLRALDKSAKVDICKRYFIRHQKPYFDKYARVFSFNNGKVSYKLKSE